MALLPSPVTPNFNTATFNYNPADLFTRPLPDHRFKARIPLSLSTTVTPTTASTSSGASASVVSSGTSIPTDYTSELVQAHLVPRRIDSGASRSFTPFKTTPFKSDFVLTLSV